MVIMNLIARDLETENATLREELERAHIQLHHMDEIKRSFIALAAHELRTPLTMIYGYAKLLGDRGNDEMQEYASIIAAYSWQLKNTVDSIIALHQIDAGELVLRPETLPLGEIIEHAVASRQREIVGKALAIQLNLEDDLYVRADRERLPLILAQLLSNSINYTPHAGTVTIDARSRQASVVISIQDNGIGIPEGELPHIFERFYQIGHPLTRQHNGAGLGLAVAKELVELHSGRLWAESASNQGSTFYFSLPRAVPSNRQNAIVNPPAKMII